VVISGDTLPCEAIAVAAAGADVLVHEATFTEEEADRARQTGHSTARGAAQLALDAEVALLALTHVSTRYAGRELRDEAREVFARACVPRDFDSIEIPFPERGRPRAGALVLGAAVEPERALANSGGLTASGRAYPDRGRGPSRGADTFPWLL